MLLIVKEGNGAKVLLRLVMSTSTAAASPFSIARIKVLLSSAVLPFVATKPSERMKVSLSSDSWRNDDRGSVVLTKLVDAS